MKKLGPLKPMETREAHAKQPAPIVRQLSEVVLAPVELFQMITVIQTKIKNIFEGLLWQPSG